MPTVGEIISFLKAETRAVLPHGHSNLPVTRPCSLTNAAKGDITFISKATSKTVQLLETCSATLIVIPRNLKLSENHRGKALIHSDNPRLEFIRILQQYFDANKLRGIHNSAIVHLEAKLHPDIYIGPYAVIGKCFIDEGTVVHGGAYLYDNVRVGRNVLIHSGAVLGADGLGFEKTEDGSWAKFPHLGGVVVEDEVEIGANSCIDRGALDDTRIGHGSKLDNLVHIAHNVQIGRNCMITAGAIFAGSVNVEDNAWIGPGARILEKVKIGRGAKVGMGAVVTQNVAACATVAAALSKTFKLEA